MLQSLKSRYELVLLLWYTLQQGTNRSELLYATALIRWLDVAGLKYVVLTVRDSCCHFLLLLLHTCEHLAEWPVLK
jgi:hypothetical protein